MSKYLHIKGGRIIDPANNRDEVADLFAKDGKIVDSLTNEEIKTASVIDATNLVVCPGLVDVHVHFRDPGQKHKETIASGSKAAAAGGVTSVVCMPNTAPALDNLPNVEYVLNTAKRDANINVFTSGTLTKDRAGKEMAPIGSLKEAGVVGLTDDGDCIQDNELMLRACDYAKSFDLPIFDHCQDYALTQGSVMHEGEWSTKLGLKGWPTVAEEIIVARNIAISAATGAHIHMQHITSSRAVAILRDAKKQGINVTAEVTPHHLALTDECLKDYDTHYKMNPPLRTESDRLALIEGLMDGTLDIIATDHAPHAPHEKDVEFDQAPFGITGLETMLSVCIETLVNTGICDLPFLISRLTHKPSELLKLNKGTLSIGADADITLFSETESWTYTEDSVHSLSKNSPWLNKKLIGKVKQTIVAGKSVFPF